MGHPRDLPLETPVREVADSFGPEHPLIDIRTGRERNLGYPEGSTVLGADELLQNVRAGTGTGCRGAFVICAEGERSEKLVSVLKADGFGNFSSVSGGFHAWREAALPAIFPGGFTAEQSERYARHLVMPQVGAEGQRRLQRSRILLVGLGGLNSPVALYLAAAGVGTLGLVDFDRVERSNLQRQIIHGDDGLGSLKATSASERIRDLNPEVETVTIEKKVNADNAGKLIDSWDIVVDGTDSFDSRYALNDACIERSTPLVYGAVMRFQGQASVFWPAYAGSMEAPCFRCLSPVEPAPGEAPGCAEAGVLGVLPGLVGTLQANEALKLALGIGKPLVGSLLMIDALNMEFRKMRIRRRPGCPACA